MYLLYARAEWIDAAVLRGDRLCLIALNPNRAGECFEQFFPVLFYDARDLREVRAAFFSFVSMFFSFVYLGHFAAKSKKECSCRGIFVIGRSQFTLSLVFPIKLRLLLPPEFQDRFP